MSNLNQQRRSPSFTRAAITLALASAALVLLASIVFLSFRATEESPKATFVDCQAITQASGRLACYDALAKQQTLVPAKGGEAIVPSQSSSAE